MLWISSVLFMLSCAATPAYGQSGSADSEWMKAEVGKFSNTDSGFMFAAPDGNMGSHVTVNLRAFLNVDVVFVFPGQMKNANAWQLLPVDERQATMQEMVADAKANWAGKTVRVSVLGYPTYEPPMVEGYCSDICSAGYCTLQSSAEAIDRNRAESIGFPTWAIYGVATSADDSTSCID
jgi:hypothetical protein